jgi:DNA-binding transcriptional ArsR family regulator
MTAGGGVAILVAAATIGSGAAPVLELLIGLTTFMVGLIRGSRVKAELKRLPIGQLRPTPAALPAGDAQVAAIASALAAAKAPDVRVRLEELASLVQRLCDANHALAGAGSEVSSAPIRPLVELAKATAEAIDAIDHQLATLDEGLLVRALARSEARKEPPALRAELLAGLDTLRQLEEQRATLFRRLLEITSLARVAIEHGLAEAAALRSDDIEVAHALASLDD